MGELKMKKFLINEGFTEKTLSNFNEKQLFQLTNRIIEQTTTVRKGSVIMNKMNTTPTDIKKFTDVGTNVELREKKIKKPELNDEESDLEDMDTKESLKMEMKSWVNDLIENEYHSFTSKKDIMNLIEMKVNQKNEQSPTIAPPTTKPGTTPKRKSPMKPGPGINTNPKSMRK